MPRNVRTARGEVVDFDALVVKQQLAQAPMNVEVARRKEFIDNKEGRARGQRSAVQTETIAPEADLIDVEPKPSAAPADFELEAAPTPKKK